MEYRKHRIEYLRTTVEYSLFGGEGGTREAHLMFHVDPEAGSYEEQLTAIRKAYHRILSRKVKIRGMVPVFCRYFLSDAANQGGFAGCLAERAVVRCLCRATAPVGWK